MPHIWSLAIGKLYLCYYSGWMGCTKDIHTHIQAIIMDCSNIRVKCQDFCLIVCFLFLWKYFCIKTMDWTVADILYSYCANSVWLGQYFYCKNFCSSHAWQSRKMIISMRIFCYHFFKHLSLVCSNLLVEQLLYFLFPLNTFPSSSRM